MSKGYVLLNYHFIIERVYSIITTFQHTLSQKLDPKKYVFPKGWFSPRGCQAAKGISDNCIHIVHIIRSPQS